MLSVDEVAQALPANLKSAATQQLTDLVNNIVSDPLVAEQVRDNFIGYANVLKDGKFKIEDYVHAVTYVSFKLMGYSNQEAYYRTFPQRHQALLAKGASKKDISAYVSAYHKGKLVNLIMEQTLIPTWVLNQDIFQKAINVQADLMVNATSEKVRAEAANSLLTHLKRPEAKEVNLKLGVTEDPALGQLQEALRNLAVQQIDAIENGVPTRQIAAQPIVDAEYSEVDTD